MAKVKEGGTSEHVETESATGIMSRFKRGSFSAVLLFLLLLLRSGSSALTCLHSWFTCTRPLQKAQTADLKTKTKTSVHQLKKCINQHGNAAGRRQDKAAFQYFLLTFVHNKYKLFFTANIINNSNNNMQKDLLHLFPLTSPSQSVKRGKAAPPSKSRWMEGKKHV